MVMTIHGHFHNNRKVSPTIEKDHSVVTTITVIFQGSLEKDKLSIEQRTLSVNHIALK